MSVWQSVQRGCDGAACGPVWVVPATQGGCHYLHTGWLHAETS